MPNQGTIEAIERAKRYPFERPPCSYVFSHDHEHLLEGHPDSWEIDLTELTPVFGYASNMSAAALAHKFASIPEVHIPVIAFDLEGYDAVYSCHVSAGYVPAMILPSEGTALKGYMTYLDGPQLKVMDASESRGENYALRELTGASGTFLGGERLDDPLVYDGLHGHLAPEGSPVAVGGTVAENRAFEEKSQADMFEIVRAEIAPNLGTDEFIGALIASRTRRRAWTAELKRSALRAPD